MALARRLTEEQTDQRYLARLSELLDNWLFVLEEHNLAERRWMPRTQWLRLREIVRVFDPAEWRESIWVQHAIDLLFDLQEELLGDPLAQGLETEREPAEKAMGSPSAASPA